VRDCERITAVIADGIAEQAENRKNNRFGFRKLLGDANPSCHRQISASGGKLIIRKNIP
jgi:hypothetical protein